MKEGETAERFMRRALELAERGRGLTSPNPLVGAVVVTSGGDVVGEGFHARAGGPTPRSRPCGQPAPARAAQRSM